jgi:RecB family exonuclease
MTSYSHSSLMLFEQCPRAFQYKYILRKPEAFSTIEQHLGTCVHAALHDAYARRAEGRAFSAEELVQSFDAHWSSAALDHARVIKRGMFKGTYHADGLVMVRSFFRLVYSRDASDSLFLEHRFTTNLETGTGKTHAFTGVIDRVSRTEDGRITLLDYKTGKSVPDPRVDLQLRAYALFVFKELGAEEMDLSYEDLRGTTRSTVLMRRGETAGVADTLCGKIAVIEKATDFPSRPSTLCDWCGYNESCDARGAGSGRRSAGQDEGDACPRCGGDLQQRNGRRGSFLGCSNFPACRYTRDEW